jgi:hypothetical protein
VSYAFQPRTGLVLVEAEVSGPTGKAGATLILDTGATGTALNANLLRSVGYDPDTSTDFAQMTTGTSALNVPRLMVNRLSALGRHAVGLRVLAHSLPATAAADGLLGLDFFRDLVLTTDFRAGRITVT